MYEQKDKHLKINREDIFNDIDDNLDGLTKEDLSRYILRLCSWLAYNSSEMARAETAFNASWVGHLEMGKSCAESKVRARVGQVFKDFRIKEIEYDAVKEMINGLKKRLEVVLGESEHTRSEHEGD
jgi:hypothetical protein